MMYWWENERYIYFYIASLKPVFYCHLQKVQCSMKVHFGHLVSMLMLIPSSWLEIISGNQNNPWPKVRSHSFIQKPICTSVVCSWNQKPICSSVVCWQAKMKDLTFCCPVCSKDFSTKRKLKNHSYIHEESQETCDQCGELFSNKVKLRNHSRSHQVFLTNHASPPDFFLLRSKSIFDLKKPPWQK